MTDNQIQIAIIIACSENWCIGKDNDLPWYIPADLKRTKEITMGKPLIMGRKTYESIVARRNGKPLPGRDSLIISRNMAKPDFENVFVHSSLEEALEQGKEISTAKGMEELIIFGGAQIYEQALPITDRIYLTKVHMNVDGDAFFSEPGDEWTEISNEQHLTEDGLAYSYITLQRS